MRFSASVLALGCAILAGCSLNTGGSTDADPVETSDGATTTTTTTTGVTTATVVTEFWTRDEPSDPAIEAVRLNNSEFAGVLDATLGGVTFVAGTSDVGAVGYTSINGGSDAGAEVTTGDLTFSANYKLVQFFNVEVSGSDVSTDTRIDSGLIELTADFDAATLTGSYQDLSVAGQIVATDLDGAVTYRGVNGSLDGLIGNDGVLGAFHGSDDGMLFVGGFVGASN